MCVAVVDDHESPNGNSRRLLFDLNGFVFRFVLCETGTTLRLSLFARLELNESTYLLTYYNNERGVLPFLSALCVRVLVVLVGLLITTV